METAQRTRLGIAALGAAAILGVLGDAFLQPTPWGASFPLWMGLLILTIGLLARRGLPISPSVRLLAIPVLLFSLCFAWRDSDDLKLVNLSAILLLVGIAALRSRTGKIAVASLTDYSGRLIARFAELIADFCFLIGLDIDWKSIAQDGQKRAIGAVARGLIITVPVLVVFGGLLASADAVFEKGIRDAFNWDLESMLTHTTVAFGFMWLSGGILRRMLLANEVPPMVAEAKPEEVGKNRFGIIEVGMLLTALNVLFGAFVIIQLRYLFGGAQLVAITPNLSYADYARKGFFELVSVAALALPLLLGLHSLLKTEAPIHRRIYQVLAGITVILLLIVMASAAQRMRLYVGAYGLTEQRLYAAAAMAWLALVFGWFIATALRGRDHRFAFGGVVAWVVVAAALNVANPDALIARVNTQTLPKDRIDATHLAGLSADAIPVLAKALPTLSPNDRAYIQERIAARWVRPTTDWRGFNVARAEATDQATRLTRTAGR